MPNFGFTPVAAAASPFNLPGRDSIPARMNIADRLIKQGAILTDCAKAECEVIACELAGLRKELQKVRYALGPIDVAENDPSYGVVLLAGDLAREKHLSTKLILECGNLKKVRAKCAAPKPSNGRPVASGLMLEEFEWLAYCRRLPVRYIAGRAQGLCAHCSLPATKDNPLQHSHRIGFAIGITRLALTPEFLNGDHNIAVAHRKRCNKAVELTMDEALQYLSSFGYVMPSFIAG